MAAKDGPSIREPLDPLLLSSLFMSSQTSRLISHLNREQLHFSDVTMWKIKKLNKLIS
jgi:hypothetical protein